MRGCPRKAEVGLRYRISIRCFTRRRFPKQFWLMNTKGEVLAHGRYILLYIIIGVPSTPMLNKKNTEKQSQVIFYFMIYRKAEVMSIRLRYRISISIRCLNRRRFPKHFWLEVVRKGKCWHTVVIECQESQSAIVA